MMLHRHFEEEKRKNMTTLSDVTPTNNRELFSDDEPLEMEQEDYQPKRGRRRKTED